MDVARMVSLRPYQKDAISAVLAARREGVRRMVVALPTGAGKTVIFAELAKLARRPVLVIAHREELLAQARDKLARALGDPSLVSIERGGDRAAPSAKVVVSSIRSLHASRLAGLLEARAFGLVVYDECHHAVADDNLRVLRQLGAFAPDWDGTLLGFTATTERGDGKGLDTAFERIVYARSLPEMIDDGFLVSLRGFRIATGADLSRVLPRGGDLDEEALAEAVDVEDRNALVARSIQELARDRRTVAFCVNVQHARNLAGALRLLGVPAAAVYGAMPMDEREDTLARFRAGALRVLTNVAVLTEGFDDPGVACVAMARPTRSSGLYAQCVGRGTRLAPDKKDCLILDFADVSSLDLCTLPSLFGVPRDIDLGGEDVREARRLFARITLDVPGFELEAGAVTLGEIEARAASFNPLTLAVDPEVRAISGNAWFSLGRHGVGLHFERRPGRASEALVLARGARGKRWEVSLDGRAVARFSTLEEAVSSVDFEIDRFGRATAASARPDAEWRAQSSSPAGGAPSRETTLRLATFERVARRR